MIVLVDNYDSFTYNLYQYMGEFDSDIRVFRNDEIDGAGILALNPDRVVISPGPKTPEEAGNCIEIIKTVIEFLKIKKFKRTIAEQLLKKYSKECLIALYQQKFYQIKIFKNKKAIEKLEQELNLFDFNSKMKEYSELSTQIFKAKLAEKYTLQKRKTYTIDELQT